MGLELQQRRSASVGGWHVAKPRASVVSLASNPCVHHNAQISACGPRYSRGSIIFPNSRATNSSTSMIQRGLTSFAETPLNFGRVGRSFATAEFLVSFWNSNLGFRMRQLER